MVPVEEETADERDCVELLECAVGMGLRKADGDLFLDSVESLLWFLFDGMGRFADGVAGVTKGGVLDGGGGAS